MSWSAADIPDQAGRTFVVTGANSGLGAETAHQLADHGARLVLACRNIEKGDQVAAQLGGEISVRRLDLADLASVRTFADATGDIDVLINNAGIMAVPEGRTADGFETQIGTNFLGHFALTGLLLPKISARVVTLSSGVHRIGHIDLDDLNWRTRRYRRWSAYAQSKLADLIFAFELQRRLTAAGSPVVSVAAHPGYAATGLQSHTESAQDRFMALANRVVAQNAQHGALPTLYAATMPDVVGGDYYGPSGLGELRGQPGKVGASREAKQTALGSGLWLQAETLTQVSYL